jgi:hypothetical protein
MRKETHIYFDEELYQTIKEYSVAKKKSINEAVNTLVKLGLDTNSNKDLADDLKTQMNDTNKKANLTFLLLRQLYSDLAFPKISETREYESLNQFFRSIKADKYDN